jgi:mono/diheme cytochrome c family protein
MIAASAMCLLDACGGTSPQRDPAVPVAIETSPGDPEEGIGDGGESDLLRHLRGLTDDLDALDGGRELFAANCRPCHGTDGEGIIGPNLTDDSCKHPNDLLGIRGTIELGLAERGMPAWGPVLGEARLNQLTVYVHSIQERQIPGRDPEGRDCSSFELEVSRDLSAR